MPEKIPLEPGKFYHLFNRGNNRQLLFREEDNYHYFLRLAKRHILDICELYAYALLPDHFHLLIRIKEESILKEQGVNNARQLSHKFGNWFNAYAKAYNKRFNRVSSLFEHRFERKLITNELQLFTVIYYLHFNPSKHGYVNDFRKWPYSSYTNILSDEENYLAKDQILKWFGGKEGFVKAHDRLTSEVC